MFRVRYNPFGNHEVTHDWGTLRWKGDLPGQLNQTYKELTAEKKRRFRAEGEDGAGYVDAEQAAKSAEQAAKEAKRQQRDEMIRQLYQNIEE